MFLLISSWNPYLNLSNGKNSNPTWFKFVLRVLSGPLCYVRIVLWVPKIIQDWLQRSALTLFKDEGLSLCDLELVPYFKEETRDRCRWSCTLLQRRSESSLGGNVHMTSAKFSGFLTPSPPCLHFGPIHSTKFTQPPLLHLLLGYPPPPPTADIICTCPLSNISWGEV